VGSFHDKEPKTNVKAIKYCVNILASNIDKLNKAKKNDMKAFYDLTFKPLYKQSYENFKNDNRKEILVYY